MNQEIGLNIDEPDKQPATAKKEVKQVAKKEPAQSNPLAVFFKNELPALEKEFVKQRMETTVNFLIDKQLIDPSVKDLDRGVIAGNPLLATMDALIQAYLPERVPLTMDAYKKFLEAVYAEAIQSIKNLKV